MTKGFNAQLSNFSHILMNKEMNDTIHTCKHKRSIFEQLISQYYHSLECSRFLEKNNITYQVEKKMNE